MAEIIGYIILGLLVGFIATITLFGYLWNRGGKGHYF